MFMESLNQSHMLLLNEQLKIIDSNQLSMSLFDATGNDPEDAFHWIEQIAQEYAPLDEAHAYKIRKNSLSSNLFHSVNLSMIDNVMDRTLFITYLKKLFGYKSYLEIGCRGNHNYSRVPFADKTGIDPISGGNVTMTSDEYFSICDRKFDLVFIDGLHEREQVIRDVKNSLKHLNTNGTILLHDCMPLYENEATYPMSPGAVFWNGNVWQAIVYLRTINQIDIMTGDFDWGIGIIRVHSNTNPLYLSKSYNSITWKDYETNYENFLRPSNMQNIHKWLINQL